MAVTKFQEVCHTSRVAPSLLWRSRLLSQSLLTNCKRVYALLSQIPPGRVSTYAALGKALNSSPRAVGGALRRNPFAPKVPCHRIICANGVMLILYITKSDKHTYWLYVGDRRISW
jgi:O-6-methylguanine DNA methyltransferase